MFDSVLTGIVFCSLVIILGVLMLIDEMKIKYKRISSCISCIILIMVGLFAIYCGIVYDKYILAMALIAGLGLWLFSLGLSRFYVKNTCTEEISAEYVDRITVSANKRGEMYAPIFRYHYRGEEYESRSIDSFSLTEMNCRFKKNKTYTIYVSSRNPSNLIVEKVFEPKDIIFILMGIALMAHEIIEFL